MTSVASWLSLMRPVWWGGEPRSSITVTRRRSSSQSDFWVKREQKDVETLVRWASLVNCRVMWAAASSPVSWCSAVGSLHQICWAQTVWAAASFQRTDSGERRLSSHLIWSPWLQTQSHNPAFVQPLQPPLCVQQAHEHYCTLMRTHEHTEQGLRPNCGRTDRHDWPRPGAHIPCCSSIHMLHRSYCHQRSRWGNHAWVPWEQHIVSLEGHKCSVLYVPTLSSGSRVAVT